MKKQNILSILLSDNLKEKKQKEENFNMVITDFDKCIEDYIIPYLSSKENQEVFGYVFNLNTNDDIVKEKTLRLLNVITKLFKEVVSVAPEYFLTLQKEKDFEYACQGICATILLGNDINKLVK